MPIAPSDAEVIRDAIDARLFDVRTCTVARVKAYDREKRVADLIPVIQRPLENGLGELEHEETCVLPNVPVKWPRAGGFVLHLPLREGDHVLVLCTDDSISMWRETGTSSIPGDRRQHHLASVVAIPGAFCGLELLDPEQEETLAGILDESWVLGSETTEARIEGDDDEVRLGANATAPIALAPPIVALVTAFKAWAALANPKLAALMTPPTETAAFEAAVTALNTACDNAIDDTPATLAKGK